MKPLFWTETFCLIPWPWFIVWWNWWYFRTKQDKHQMEQPSVVSTLMYRKVTLIFIFEDTIRDFLWSLLSGLFHLVSHTWYLTEHFTSELERLSVALIMENQSLLHENKQLNSLMQEYEQTLETVMSKLRGHCVRFTSFSWNGPGLTKSPLLLPNHDSKQPRLISSLSADITRHF